MCNNIVKDEIKPEQFEEIYIQISIITIYNVFQLALMSESINTSWEHGFASDSKKSS